MSFPKSHRDSPELGAIGFEIELLAPKGRSRKDLADAIADRHGGIVRRFFHPQGEPSKAKNTPFFENLTLGFVVEDDAGNIIAQCVDDLTLQDDLDSKHPPQPGWYRIVSDDPRLLRLTMRQTDATQPLKTVLNPIADLFGTSTEQGENQMVRIADQAGAPVVLGATLPGERERPCELITPPIRSNHKEYLEDLLGIVRDLGFTIPVEAALHLHFDGASLCDAATIANLIRLLGIHTEPLKDRFHTNPRCRRLGMWPAALFDLIGSPAFARLQWQDAKELLGEINLTKYCDFNILNLVRDIPDKHTFEVRILPVWLDAEKITTAAKIFSTILHWAKGGNRAFLPIPDSIDEIVDNTLFQCFKD